MGQIEDMTPQQTLPAIDAPLNPLQLLGAYRHVEFPVDESRTPAWEAAFSILQHNFRLTITFGTAQAGVMQPDTEKYDTVMKAKAEAIEARLTMEAARKAGTPEEFRGHVEKLKTQYATLIGHIRHLFFVDKRFRPLCIFVEDQM